MPMRKRTIEPQQTDSLADDGNWLNLEQLATVEFSSEDAAYPIEAALRVHGGEGWRAAAPGTQLIRLIFDQPQPLRRIKLVFQEHAQPRTQEFVLRWSRDGGHSYQDVLRQQYTFSPPETSRELETYQVNLDAVTTLELQIIPDISGGSARAGLAALRLA
jgi:hypothetical protein